MPAPEPAGSSPSFIAYQLPMTPLEEAPPQRPEPVHEDTVPTAEPPLQASAAPMALGTAMSIGASALRGVSAGMLKEGLVAVGRQLVSNAGWVGAAVALGAALVYMGAARKLDEPSSNDADGPSPPTGRPQPPEPDVTGTIGAALLLRTAQTGQPVDPEHTVATPIGADGKPLHRSPFLPREGELDPNDERRLALPATPADATRASAPTRDPKASSEDTQQPGKRDAPDPVGGPHAPEDFPESRMVQGARRPWLGHLLVKMPSTEQAARPPPANTHVVVAHGEALNRTFRIPQGTALTVVALGNGLSDDVARSLMHGDYTGFARPGDPTSDPAEYNTIVRLLGMHTSLDGLTTWVSGANAIDMTLASAVDMPVDVEAFTPPSDYDLNLSELLVENAGHLILITCTAGLRQSTGLAFGPMANLEDPNHAQLEATQGKPVVNLEKAADLPGVFQHDAASGEWTRNHALMRQQYRESLHVLEAGRSVWYPDLLVHDPRVDPPLATSAYTVAPEAYDFNAYKLPEDVRAKSHLAARPDAPDYWQTYHQENEKIPQAERDARDAAIREEMDKIRATLPSDDKP